MKYQVLLTQLLLLLLLLLKNTTGLNAKINQVKNKIPNIINLATNTAVTSVENKIFDVGNLVKKTEYNTKITNYDHDKHITSPEFNMSTAENFAARLGHIRYYNIAGFVKQRF